MNLEIYKYLNEYIKNKFPMYYRAVKKNEYMSFVNSIASNPVFKKYGVTAVRNGETDEIIDKLVSGYAQIKLTNIWANFGGFKDYIRDVIIKKDSEWSQKICEDTGKLATEFCPNKKVKYLG